MTMSKFGFVAILIYLAFIIYIFIDNIVSKTMIDNIKEYNWLYNGPFIRSFSEITGNFALAFMTHNVVAQITANNVVKKNTSRNVGLAYLVGTLIYFLLGFLGSLGILGRVPPDGRDPENIM